MGGYCILTVLAIHLLNIECLNIYLFAMFFVLNGFYAQRICIQNPVGRTMQIVFVLRQKDAETRVQTDEWAPNENTHSKVSNVR